MNLRIETRLPIVSGKPLIAHKFPKDIAGLVGGFPISMLGTVGAELGEPYAIAFTNASADRVEVRFSIDGLDIFTGKPADLSTNGQRMLVEAYATVKLEAWPESHAGGARFVFAPDGMAVADHRPSSSPKGIIAAAVFVESAVQHSVLRSMSPTSFGSHETQRHSYGGGGDFMRGGGATKGGGGDANPRGSMDSYVERAPSAYGAPSGDPGPAKGVGTGAGEYVAQELRTTQGLRAPRLGAIYQLRVVSWEDLRARIAQGAVAAAPIVDLAAYGFPAQKSSLGPDLSGIPRMPSVQREPSRLG